MKFEEYEGKQVIVIEDSEKVLIKTPEREEYIELENDNEQINITGDSSLVGEIYGDGMLQKVYIQPFSSKEEIIDKCEAWLMIFRKTLDIFREAVFYPRFREQEVYMNLSFSKKVYDEAKDLGADTITLNLIKNGLVVEKGVGIVVPSSDKGVFNYLMASVIAYYLQENYGNYKIERYQSINWEKKLFHKDINRYSGRIIFTDLEPLYEDSERVEICSRLIANHNLGIEPDQIIGTLKDKIESQRLSDSFLKSNDESFNQYKYVLTSIQCNRKDQ